MGNAVYLAQLIIQMFFRSYSERLNAEVIMLLYIRILVANLYLPMSVHYVFVYIATV